MAGQPRTPRPCNACVLSSVGTGKMTGYPESETSGPPVCVYVHTQFYSAKWFDVVQLAKEVD